MKRNQTMRRGLSVLLSLVLCLSLLPATALAAEPVTETADFTEYGNHAEALALLNAAKTGEAESTWDSDTKTLTLNGVNFITTNPTAVALPKGAKIVLAAGTENTITGVCDDTVPEKSYGIYVWGGDLTIEGSGQLTVTAGKSIKRSYGIYVYSGDLTITSGTVTANSGEAANSYGIYAVGDVTISGKTTEVTTIGGRAKSDKNDNSPSSVGLSGEHIDISGGTVIATGSNVRGSSSSNGIKVVYFTITGGTVTATGGNADDQSYGIFSLPPGGSAPNSSISGGHVTARTLADANTKTRMALSQAPTLSGYTDYQWRTSSGDSFTSSANAEYSHNNDYTYVEFSSQSTVTTYTVSFNANGGSGSMDAETVVSGSFTLPACTFTAPSGKQFKAWSVNGTEYAVGESITVSADTTVTAIWENIPTTTCTVRFDANGGTGSMDAVTVTSGEYTLPACGFTAPSGKQFAGWATSADGTVITGTTITVTENTTLYAIWEDIPATTRDQTADFTTDAIAALKLLNDAKTEGAADSTWNSGTKTLTLNGVNFSTSAAIAVKLPDGATIVLAEGTTNTIASTFVSTGGLNQSFGIYARDGGLTITGGGQLTVTGGTAPGSYGIYANTGVTISGGTVEATGGAAESFSCGICAEGGNVSISNTTKVNAMGGAVTVQNGKSHGIYANNVTISDTAEVTATGGKATDEDSKSYGIYADRGDVTISNTAKVNAMGGEATDEYDWSYGIYAVGDMDISGGIVAATGGEVTGDRSGSYGIYAVGDMDISGGHVTARTLAGTDAGTRAALSKAPVLSGYTGGYYWCASGKSSFTSSADEAYSYSQDHTYVEFSDEHLYILTAYGLYGGTMGIEPGETYIVTAAARDEVGVQVGIRDGYKLKDVTLEGITEGDLIWAGKDSEEFVDRGFVFDMPENDVTVTVNWERIGGSGGGSTATYAIAVDSTKNGAVIASHKSAAKGTTVTLTVDPDKGYTLETITVTDKNGDEIELTNKGDGKYTFTMPASKVTVKVTFMEDNSMLNFFVDVPAGAYYYDAVLWAAENGITGGVDDTHFAPDASCTRAQMVTFLWRAAGSPKVSGSNPFSDVSADAYYYDAVLWAVKNGITSGTSATTFAPDAAVTRGQTVTFLYRAAGSPAASGSGFSDVSSDAYYADAVAWAVQQNITTGTGNGQFSPNADCTRAQIVTFLYRAMGE